MSELLDKLKALEDRGRPAPPCSGHNEGPVFEQHTPECRRFFDAGRKRSELAYRAAPHIPKLVEALEKFTMLDMEGGEDMLRAVGGGLHVLAELEEALDA